MADSERDMFACLFSNITNHLPTQAITCAFRCVKPVLRAAVPHPSEGPRYDDEWLGGSLAHATGRRCA